MQQSSTRFASLIRYTTGAMAALTVLVTAQADAHAASRRIASTQPVVADVDLSRYAGKWFEILNPTWSATATCNDAMDVYTANPNATDPNARKQLTATHSCTRAGLLIHRADGTLSAPNPAEPARLVLEAKSTLGRSSYTHYDIIDLDADYQWAVIGDDTRRYVWILSRTPDLDADTLKGIMSRLNSSEEYHNAWKSLSCVKQSTATTQNCKTALGL